MSEQQRAGSSQQSQRVEDELDPTPPPAAAPQAQSAGADDILDEIDGVLEANAEEFVRGFVQKGGQ